MEYLGYGKGEEEVRFGGRVWEGEANGTDWWWQVKVVIGEW